MFRASRPSAGAPPSYTRGGDRISGRIGFLSNAAQNELAPFETRTRGYTDVSGSLRVRIAGSAERPIDLTFTAHNLSNQGERNAISFKKDVTLLPGRDIRLALDTHF
jgi:hypothetical protein